MGDETLSVLLPVDIYGAGVLTSSTATEADHSAWSGATTYALADRVISTSTHMIYESAAGSNLNNDPTDINNRTGSTIWWIEVSPTNRWKMFDGESNSQTTFATPLTVVLAPGFVNSLYAGNLIGDSAIITMKDVPGGTTVFSETVQLENSFPPDYYEYFFSPYSQQPDLLIDDLPPYYGCELTFSLTATTGNVSCGMFQVGDLIPIGESMEGASAEPKTYSYIQIDDFGNNEIVRRKSARDMNVSAIVDLDYANTAIDIITSILDVPTLWVASPLSAYSALRVFGLGSAKYSYDYAHTGKVDITVKGLI
jgi:hypothetical protein